jgi:hypothetical protein
MGKRARKIQRLKNFSHTNLKEFEGLLIPLSVSLTLIKVKEGCTSCFAEKSGFFFFFISYITQRYTA